MNNLFRKFRPLSLLLILSLLLFNTACDKEEKGETPELPPVESMLMDFTDYLTNPSPSVKGTADKVQEATYENFIYAYETVSFWNTLTIRTMIFPVAAYTTALQQEPEYLGNNTWEWSYTVTVEQQEIIVTLTGKRLSNEEFSMVMNIAYSEAPLLKMKYLEGICRYDHTEASWDVYSFYDISAVKSLESVKAIEIDWTKDFETGDASLKYTYVKPGEEETNHSITWVYDPDGTYDAGYYIDKQDSSTDIEWNTTSKAGRVRWVSAVAGFDWRCWDELLRDTTCPGSK